MALLILDYSSMLYLMLWLPLLAAISSATVVERNVREAVTLLLGTALCVTVFSLIGPYYRGELPTIVITEILPGLELVLELDSLGLLFALLASILWIVTTVYTIGYMRGNFEAHQGRFFAFFALAIFATMGICLAGNLITLFLFYELLTLSTFPLVTHHMSQDAKRSGRIYLGILLGTSIIGFLTATILTYHLTCTTYFMYGGILHHITDPLTIGILLLLFTYGIGKTALMPFHGWLPAAMVAPTPVSALLHAVAVVKAGVFTFIKVIVYIFGIDHLRDMISLDWIAGGWLPWLAGLTILLASITALRQDNLKLRLAYSTISQLAYVVLAVSLLVPIGVMAAVFHLVAHALGKITLFFVAGSIYTVSKKKYIHQLDGIGRRMPWTMTAFAIASLSMIGLPPAAGFLSKYYMLWGAFEIESTLTIAVLLLSTLLNAAYFLPIIYAAFFKEEPHNLPNYVHRDHKEAPVSILLALMATALATLALFAFPDTVLSFGQHVGEGGQLTW